MDFKKAKAIIDDAICTKEEEIEAYRTFCKMFNVSLKNPDSVYGNVLRRIK